MNSDNNIWQKMVSGQIYDATDPSLLKPLSLNRKRIRQFNDVDPENEAEMHRLLKEILGTCPDNIQIDQPFRCDYGTNIHIGENFFANFSLTILDEAPVTIGRDVFIGPNVSIYTACHPLDADERRTRNEWAEPVTIGNDVWIGGNVTIVPGVTIGNRCVIGAGSVVTRNIPDDTLVVGNPARVIRKLTEQSQ